MKYLLIFTLSILLHLSLYLTLGQVRPNPNKSTSLPIEISYKNPENKQLVLEANVPDNLLAKDDNKKVKLLSKAKQRVTKETKSQNIGLTKNEISIAKKQKNNNTAYLVKEKNSPLKNLKQNNDPSGLIVSTPQKKNKYTLLLPTQSLNQEELLNFSALSEVLPKEIQSGIFTALNTDQNLFYSFYERVSKKLRFQWESNVDAAVRSLSSRNLLPAVKTIWTSQVEVILDPSGYLKNIIVYHESGQPYIDEAAVLAFRRTTPYLNPPKEMIKDDGLIHLFYGFQLTYIPRLFAQPF